MADSSELSTQKLLADLWQRNQPIILERLAQLDAAVAALAAGSLTEDLRAAAESTAHKLSGTLGMFGFHEGTTIARELEQELQSLRPEVSRLFRFSRNLRASIFPPLS